MISWNSAKNKSEKHSTPAETSRYTIIRWYFSFACILQQIRISVYLIRKYKMLDKMEAWVSKFRTLIQTYWRRLFFSSLFKIFILLILQLWMLISKFSQFCRLMALTLINQLLVFCRYRPFSSFGIEKFKKFVSVASKC